MDCSLPGSSVPGILQARVLEWGAVAFSSEFEDRLINNSACTFPSSKNSGNKLAPSPKYLLTCYFSSQLMDCQEFIKHSSQNKNASPAICKREPHADPSRTRVPCVVNVSWKLANPSLWVEKLTEFFFLTLNPPYSLLRTLKYCFLHVQLCGRRRLRPQRSGSRRRVHHHRGSRPPPGFMSTVGVHVHRQGSRPLSSPWR